MADETIETAEHGPMCPPEDTSAGAPEVPVTTSEAPALPASESAPGIPGIPGVPGVPGAEGAGENPAGSPDGPALPPIRSVGTAAGPFAADVGVVEGAKCAVRTLARRLAGVADSEVTVPASAEVVSQAVFACGAQWVMASDLTPGTLYFVAYDAIQLAYFVDAYAPVPGGRLTAPREHGYA